MTNARAGLAAALIVSIATGGCMGPPLSIIPETLPAGVVGQIYRLTLDTADNAARVQWFITSGRLPDGLALSGSTGEILGRPTVAGDFMFTAFADDGGLSRRTGERTFLLTIHEPLEFDRTLDIGRVGNAYEFELAITGGVPPYDAEVIGLPAGLAFDGATFTISGTPVTANNGTTIEITVSDSAGQEETVRTSLVIKPRAVEITNTALADGEVGESYNDRLLAQDGRTPYRWTIIGGVLPNGLRLNRDTGAISGTPTAEGEFTISVRVADADDPQSVDEREFTITVVVAP